MLGNPLQNLKQLAGAYGFIELLPQKNTIMVSFVNEEDSPCRINVYWTTMTVQVQFKDGRRFQIYRDVDLEKFEDILQGI